VVFQKVQQMSFADFVWLVLNKASILGPGVYMLETEGHGLSHLGQLCVEIHV